MIDARCIDCGALSSRDSGYVVVRHTADCVSELVEARRRLIEALGCGCTLSLLDLVNWVIDRLRGLGEECYWVEHDLGVALKCPIGGADGPQPGEPAIGDHTPGTIAAKAAGRIRELEGQVSDLIRLLDL